MPRVLARGLSAVVVRGSDDEVTVHSMKSNVVPERRRRPGALVIILAPAVISFALVAGVLIAYLGARLVASGASEAGSAGPASATSAIQTRVVPLVVPTPSATRPAPAMPRQVVVSGRVLVIDQGQPGEFIVAFQRPDCPGCVRFTAPTDRYGRYRLALPEGRYRASCTPLGISAYCLPVGASFDITMDIPVNTVDFEIVGLAAGGDGGGSLPGPTVVTPLEPARDLSTRIVRPFAR